MSKTNEPISCPFCGGNADVTLRDMRNYANCFLCSAHCLSCGAQIKRQYTVPHNAKGKPEIEAKAYITRLWNRRVPND